MGDCLYLVAVCVPHRTTAQCLWQLAQTSSATNTILNCDQHHLEFLVSSMLSAQQLIFLQVRIFDMESRRCIALGQGHTEAVGVVAWPNKSTDFLISGSKDRTLKIWKSAKLKTDVDEPVTLKVRSNTVAHEKDINTIAVAPNDALFATGSQDKTIKIWPTTGVLSNPQAVLKGHKRGVWSLAFSPVDKCLASGSGDSTIKVLSCWTSGKR